MDHTVIIIITSFIAGALVAKAIISCQTKWLINKTFKRTNNGIDEELRKRCGGNDYGKVRSKK